ADSLVRIEAGMTGRVAQQWQAAFQFIGHASNDASFLEDFRSGFARAITQQYASVTRDGKQYGFLGGPALVTTPGTYQTDSQWTIGMYDMHYLSRFQKDAGDVGIGIPAMKPSQILESIARTYKDIEPVVIGDGTVRGLWARLLEYNWSGSRIGGTLNTVAGADRELYNPEKTGAAEVLIRAGQQAGDPALVQYGKDLTVFMIGYAQGEKAPLGKLMGQDLTRLHPAVALLTNSGSTPPPPPPPPTAPAAPGALAAQAASTTEIDLTWQDNSSNEDAFRVEQLVDGAFQEIRTVGAGVTSTRVGGLTAATPYSFRVRASNAAGDSVYSNTAAATTQTPVPVPTAPAAPTALTALGVSPTEIDLTWQDNSSNEDAFRVERLVNGVFQEVLIVGAGTTSTRIGNLTPGTTYGFRVRASNAAGFSAYTNAANATTQAPPTTPSGIPAAPTSLAGTATGSGTVVLTWADNSSNETTFHIERSVNGGFQQIQTVGANATTATVTGLAAASTHFFRVRASNANGYSAYTNTATVLTLNPKPSTPAPAAPNKLAARALSSSEIQLTWRDNSNNEAAFRIEQKVGSTFQEVLVVGANTTSATVSGLAPSTTYSFRIRASNS
ncbi:MAG TPA: fibronectin type III domain-containing protein, partial [Thermoanaerobaculia bacterium]|nr:fibronectin type III domain-containing protein [Thermoanaerobaculia bacterium]